MIAYQNCIFDLYGTLVDIHTDERMPRLWRAMSALYRKHGADYTPAKLRNAYFSTVQRMEQDALPPDDGHDAYPEIRIEAVFQTLFQQKGVDASFALAVETGQRFRQGSLCHLRLYDGAVELLQALRASGRGVWLLSNAQRIFTAPELACLGIESLFDGIYLSSDHGCKKPDRHFYERLLQERGIDPKSAIMIGNDADCDIRGAQAVGLHTLYIRSNLSPREPLPQADYVLPQMDLHRVRELFTQGVNQP